jgi:hypothetical protein
MLNQKTGQGWCNAVESNIHQIRRLPMLTLVKDDLSVQQDSPPPQRDYNRRRFLSWLRDEVAILRTLGMDHRRIAAQLDIEEHDVRAFRPKPSESSTPQPAASGRGGVASWPPRLARRQDRRQA